MKTPIKMFAIVIVALISSQTHAQVSMVSNQHYEAKQKIAVDLKITPSVQEFRAGLSLIDSVQNKFRLWVCNAEERKCIISIQGNAGYLWSSNFKDAYFSQVFDLSSLDDGEYFIRVANDKNNFEKKITISTNSYVKRELRIER